MLHKILKDNLYPFFFILVQTITKKKTPASFITFLWHPPFCEILWKMVVNIKNRRGWNFYLFRCIILEFWKSVLTLSQSNITIWWFKFVRFFYLQHQKMHLKFESLKFDALAVLRCNQYVVLLILKLAKS